MDGLIVGHIVHLEENNIAKKIRVSIFFVLRRRILTKLQI